MQRRLRRPRRQAVRSLPSALPVLLSPRPGRGAGADLALLVQHHPEVGVRQRRDGVGVVMRRKQADGAPGREQRRLPRRGRGRAGVAAAAAGNARRQVVLQDGAVAGGYDVGAAAAAGGVVREARGQPRARQLGARFRVQLQQVLMGALRPPVVRPLHHPQRAAGAGAAAGSAAAGRRRRAGEHAVVHAAALVEDVHLESNGVFERAAVEGV